MSVCIKMPRLARQAIQTVDCAGAGAGTVESLLFSASNYLAKLSGQPAGPRAARVRPNYAYADRAAPNNDKRQRKQAAGNWQQTPTTTYRAQDSMGSKAGRPPQQQQQLEQLEQAPA